MFFWPCPVTTRPGTDFLPRATVNTAIKLSPNGACCFRFRFVSSHVTAVRSVSTEPDHCLLHFCCLTAPPKQVLRRRCCLHRSGITFHCCASCCFLPPRRFACPWETLHASGVPVFLDTCNLFTVHQGALLRLGNSSASNGGSFIHGNRELPDPDRRRRGNFVPSSASAHAVGALLGGASTWHNLCDTAFTVVTVPTSTCSLYRRVGMFSYFITLVACGSAHGRNAIDPRSSMLICV